MGREIRRVPPNWEHPRDEKGQYRPVFDQTYEEAAQQWANDFLAWENGDNPDRATATPSARYFWEWAGGPPDEEYYRPAFIDEPTHYQIYETVSEGTPTSPVFATLDEMKDWLMREGYSEIAAAKFVEYGYAPSMIVSPTRGVSGIGIHSLDWVWENESSK